MAGSPSRSIPRSSAAPARKPKSTAGAKRVAKPSLLGRVIARPGVIVAGATFAAVMTGIIVNAVLFQKGHHPSPLFAQPQALAPEPARLVPVPVPVSRPVLDQPVPAAPTVEAPAAPAPVAVTPMPLHPTHASAKPAKHLASEGHKPVTPGQHKDLIGQLLGKAQ